MCVCVCRRNTSVDESYEWDSAEFSADPNILEAMKMEQPQAGFGRGRELKRDLPPSTAGLQDTQSKRKNLISSTCFICSPLDVLLLMAPPSSLTPLFLSS